MKSQSTHMCLLLLFSFLISFYFVYHFLGLVLIFHHNHGSCVLLIFLLAFFLLALKCRTVFVKNSVFKKKLSGAPYCLLLHSPCLAFARLYLLWLSIVWSVYPFCLSVYSFLFILEFRVEYTSDLNTKLACCIPRDLFSPLLSTSQYDVLLLFSHKDIHLQLKTKIKLKSFFFFNFICLRRESDRERESTEEE